MKPGTDRNRDRWEAQATALLEPSRAECLGETQADPGPAGNPSIGRNETNNYEPDREAGE